MASIFTRIRNGELPGRVVWEDDHAFALLTNRPIRPGHTLVVPKEEVDHWIDLPPPLAGAVMATAQRVGQAISKAFPAEKVGVAILGLEVRHVHLHLVPIDAPGDLDFANQRDATAAELDEAAAKLRAALGTTPR
jgi:histidine triad (HIT) family protein